MSDPVIIVREETGAVITTDPQQVVIVQPPAATEIIVGQPPPTVIVQEQPVDIIVAAPGPQGPRGLQGSPGASAGPPTDPHSAFFSAVSLAAGASVTFSSPAMPNLIATGELAGVVAASTIPLKVEIEAVVAAVVTIRDVLFLSEADLSVMWFPPHKSFWRVVPGGLFRVRLTNCDTIDAADVYSTLYWDQVSA